MRSIIRLAALAATAALIGSVVPVVHPGRADDATAAAPQTRADSSADSAAAFRPVTRRQDAGERPATVVVAPRVAQNAADNNARRLDPDAVPFYAHVPTRPDLPDDALAPDATVSDDAPAPSRATVPLADAPRPDHGAPRYSAWARFPVGSWSRTRTTSESVENNKRVHATTETRAELVDVDPEKRRYSLQYESTIKMGDMNLGKRSERIEYDFWDVPVVGNAVETTLPSVILQIDGRAIPCRVRRVVSVSGRLRTTVTIWYSPVAAPYVLQRETVRETLDGDRVVDADRELFVVQRVRGDAAGDPDPVLADALFSSSAADRNVAGASLRSLDVPGALLTETVADAETNGGDPLFSAATSLLDYYVADPEDAGADNDVNDDAL